MSPLLMARGVGGCRRAAIVAATAASLAIPVGCGPYAAEPAIPQGPAAPSAPSGPMEKVKFALAVDGQPAGTESWSITRPADGSEVLEFESEVDTPRGRIVGSGRYRVTPSHLPDSAEVTVRPPEAAPTTFHLSRVGADLTMSLEGGGRTDELKAGRPSNLFFPRPFFVGLAPVCALLLEKDPPALVEFPGSAVNVLGRRTLEGGVVVLSLDHGGLGRTMLACEGTEIVAVLDPWTGQSAVRVGKDAVGLALAKTLERTKPATPPDLAEEEMTVPVRSAPGEAAGAHEGEAVLACSFLRPAKADNAKAKLPAVVFATGSGPQDRDEDSPGRGGLKLSIFKVMAIALAEKGIASLRCDDRGTGKSTGTFEQATLGMFVRDSMETLGALAHRPDVDPARLGFIGHSEGAVVGPIVAARSGKLRALLLMAAPGRSLPEIGMAQEETFLKQSGLPADKVQHQLDEQHVVIEAIRSGKPLPESIRSPQREVIEKQRAWLKSHFDNDVQASLAKVPRMPVFVAQGGKDVQVPPDDAELVRSGLAQGKNKEPLIKVYPELNHVFSLSHGGGVTEYADADARVDEGFLADTVDFFGRALTK